MLRKYLACRMISKLCYYYTSVILKMCAHGLTLTSFQQRQKLFMKLTLLAAHCVCVVIAVEWNEIINKK